MAMVPISTAAEIVDAEEFGPCFLFDVVDEFTDERTSKLMCIDEDNVAVAGFQCTRSTRAVILSLGFQVDWLVTVGYRIGKGEAKWGTWRGTDRMAYLEIDSEDDDIETRNAIDSIIEEFIDGVASGHSIVLELDGTRSRVVLPDEVQYSKAVSEYRNRCVALRQTH